MPIVKPIFALALLLAHALPAAADAAGCIATREAREVASEAIADFKRGKNMEILTFSGYSAAQYEDPAAMLEQASRVLDANPPSRTLVNSGATAVGIGAIYELAKRKGYTTIGIVSTLARDEKIAISPCVDYVFFIKDTAWGGQLAGTSKLSPTSEAMVANSASIIGIGGGDIARDEMLAARKAGKSVVFIPADMNHQLAREKATERGLPPPTDFQGSAHPALINGR